jgi:hypothetical protein
MFGSYLKGDSIALADMRQRRRKGNATFIIWLVVVVAILFTVSGIFKNLLTRLGLLKTPDERAWDKMVQDGRIDVINGAVKSVQQQYALQAPTKTDFEWIQIADTIYGDLRVHLDQNDEDAGYQLSRCKNDSDVYKLIQGFGDRSIYAFGIPYKTMTLPQFITSELDAKKIGAINDNYKAKGIKFRW